MTEPRAFTFSKICVWGLTASCAALGLFGVLGMFTPDGDFWGLDRTGWCVLAFAFVMAFAIMSVNNMAEAAMDAIDKRAFRDWHWPTLAPALICAVGFAIGSNIGVHLGWSIMIASAATASLPSPETVDRVFLFLCAAKPLSMLAIAGRQAMDRARAEAAEQAVQARRDAAAAEQRAHLHEERLAEIDAKARGDGGPRQNEQSPAPPRASTGNITPITAAPKRARARSGAVAKAAVGAGLGLGAGHAMAHAETPHAAPERPVAESHAHAGADAQVARAMALKGQGLKRAQVAETMAISERQVTRLWSRGAAQNEAALAS